MCRVAGSDVPWNQRQRAFGPAAAAREVAYAQRIADSYLDALPSDFDVRGLRVLELGPGAFLGTALLLACHGALVSVADPYPPEWDDEVHEPFCRALLDHAATDPRCGDTAPLQAAIHARSFQPAVTCLQVGAESLSGIADAAFDLVVSNAVLEHVEHVPQALQHLARITATGGFGVHEVDFRDHRDFSRPLEYLVFDADVFWHDSARCHGERGNRWRHSQMLEGFVQAGFDVTGFEPNVIAETDYVARMRRRLHADFEDLSDEDLTILAGRVVCRRTTVPAAMPSCDHPGLQPPVDRRPAARQSHKRVVIYGAGAGGIDALGRLEALGLGPRLVAICDGDSRKWGTVVGTHAVQDIEHLEPSSYDSVLIASETGCAAIERRLQALGLIEDPEFRRLGFLGAFMPAREGRYAA
jgi:SAM-dependent methyltransferase